MPKGNTVLYEKNDTCKIFRLFLQTPPHNDIGMKFGWHKAGRTSESKNLNHWCSNRDTEAIPQDANYSSALD